MDNWRLLHTYRKLALDGKARPVRCPECEMMYAIKSGKDSEPVFWCIPCDSIVVPGLDLIQQIRAVVNEHYT